MPSLFVIQGRDQGRRFELDRVVTSVGRDPTCQIRLNDSEVSRRHAEIRPTADGWLWVDAGSSNGSFINSVRVENQELRSGDRLQVGGTLMIFTAANDQEVMRSDGQVDIVPPKTKSDRSRIVRRVSHQEGSRLLLGDQAGDQGEWLAGAENHLQVIYRTAQAVSHTLDIDELLQRIMDLIFEWVAADRGCIVLLDPDQDHWVPKVHRDRKQKVAAGGIRSKAEGQLEISQTILDFVRTHREGVLTSDARDDSRWDAAASIVKHGVREAICVPMQGRYGLVGAIYIDTFTTPGQLLRDRGAPKFTDSHLKLMVAIGHQAALAVEDTSYYRAMVHAERLAAIGQTIAGLSHHVKNILQGIRGGSFLIEEGLKSQDWEVTRKGWGIVEKNQERISHLVLDMLTFSKEREPELIPAHVNQVVTDVLELMQPRAEQEAIELIQQCDPTAPLTQFDPEAIHRALLNIVSNALDACQGRSGAVVQVGTGRAADDQTVEIWVRDNGPGIAPQEHEKIFQAFTSGKGNRGTGLGLAVSRKILQEHGGRIVLESEPGQGSCFRLQLPVLPEHPSAGDTLAMSPGSQSPTSQSPTSQSPTSEP